ncbi:dephospho-CoA kinase [Sulfuriflexus sp.]|uniref:dephospho-CoA kinase n=1 Tax=Sulfuriflexus sp. TaxID=2015443 RepID=UPI0028CE0D87|nr:dephospho-CoA kinase [Sulfuriflexus sp.]MDT8404335.1 dephospho-CoA kinase [Sulfuriflexus sp.]
MRVIGLTGGIASGKSAAAEHFAALGVPVIDADQIARELVEPGKPALERICERFGKSILLDNGELNRPSLREIIFKDARARHDLEAILHPLIRETIIQRIDELDAPYCIVVIPLLAESGDWAMLDRRLVIDCPEDLQLARLQQRDRLDPEQAERILAAQASREQRKAIADDIIDNSHDLAHLQRAVERLHKKYLGDCQPTS